MTTTLTFAAGKTIGDSICFTIGIYNDLIVENPEVFSVNLQSSDTRVAIAPGRNQISVTITDSPTSGKQLIAEMITYIGRVI